MTEDEGYMKKIYVKTRGTVGTVTFNGKDYPCAIGRSGTIPADQKREGDGATPLGTFALRELWYRADRLPKPVCALETHEITAEDGWSDDAASPNYNHHIKLPATESHEALRLDAPVYDVIVPLGYNDAPPVASLGSAIFLHVARPEFTPTAGCVAMQKTDLLEMLAQVDGDTVMEIS